MITLISAIDRMISVFLPTKYIQLSVRYAYLLVFCSFICVIPTFVISAITSSYFNVEYNVPKICNLQNGVTVEMFQVLRGIRIVATITGAVMYLPISIKVYRVYNQIWSSVQYKLKTKEKASVYDINGGINHC
uniref:G-protein coupled receptors family 1 profile domain-containing protein n=1 Tax=Acrobeloides nanus TaxID=290746 RepID=A0A914EK80_9BILA